MKDQLKLTGIIHLTSAAISSSMPAARSPGHKLTTTRGSVDDVELSESDSSHPGAAVVPGRAVRDGWSRHRQRVMRQGQRQRTAAVSRGETPGKRRVQIQ